MSRQRGVALITVLLVVALVTVVCAGLILRQQLAIRSTGNQLAVRQAQYYAEGGERLAQALLRRDLQTGDVQVDHPAEAWAKPLLSFPLDEGGELHLRIEDLAGRFNLNSLAAGGEAGELALLRFRRLLQQLQLNPAYAERLPDWLDTDQEAAGSGGAEDDQYLLLKPPYRTGPGRIIEVSELRLLLGMSEADYRHLLPFVSALPVAVELNINTASLPVLACLGEGIPTSTLKALIEGRGRTGYRDNSAFLQALTAYDVNPQGLTVGSRYFRATTEVTLGERRQVLVSYLQRGNDGRVRVTARDFGQDGLVPLPSEASKESEE
ncbi:general secretion pathway protein GspK [Pseudomonas alcaligenes]|uniref:Type II secretion system protein K n=1 Tax=Aquipseudomonas alcaligenes TaxID=43263 RepID=A0ABR7RXQ1_AQUAC|nr:type II secretion system minor pseudopilin GspK [Pseudomonas alcaligenes]MBC9250105.1 general secretion pathway protein GspK [Pseudomonas alcaligenes]